MSARIICHEKRERMERLIFQTITILEKDGGAKFKKQGDHTRRDENADTSRIYWCCLDCFGVDSLFHLA